MTYMKYCKKCIHDTPNEYIQLMNSILGWSKEDTQKYGTPGFYSCDNNDKEFCKYHNDEELQNMELSVDEFNAIVEVSTDSTFIIAMNNLKKNDIIEFQLKMSQFKNNVKDESVIENKIHCPKCNSTAITTSARGVNNFWGFLGASKTVNRCGNCGYTWKPNRR